MDNNSFLETNHPADRLLVCTLHLRLHTHYNYPGLNLAKEELLDDEISPDVAAESYRPPLANIGRPIPCLPPGHVEEQDNPKIDQVMQLVREKYFWTRRKKRLQVTVNRLSSNRATYSELVSIINKNETVKKLPYAVVRMTDHLAKNPDKYFKGLYNWYYGNTLENLAISNDNFLLYPSGKNLNELCMTLIEKPKSSGVVPVLIPQLSMSMPVSGFIYDIVTNDCNRTIGVRQRDACSFVNYYEDRDGTISFKNFLSVKSTEYPFVAMDNCNAEFCTVNSNRTVQFWTPDYLSQCVEYTSLPTTNDRLHEKFAQVKYESDHSTRIYVIVDRQNVYLYDKRQSYTEPCSHLRPEKQMEECEEISLLIPSAKEKTWYLGTTHSCLLLDTRMGFAEKWTHMMAQTPSLGHAFRVNKESHVLKEAVMLSTQTTNEAVVIYRNENEPRITYSPVRVPNRQDTLSEANMNGVLTNLHIQNKFSHCVIGLASYKTKKCLGVLSLVSTGDIFYQPLDVATGVLGFDKNSTCFSEEVLNYLEKWEREFNAKYMSRERSLVLSRSVDFSELVNSIDESIEIPAWESRAPPKNAHWKLSIKKLHEYKDMLTPYILSEYGVDDLEPSSDEGETDPLFDSPKKVENWLDGGGEDHSQSDDVSKQEDKANETKCLMTNSLEEDAEELDPIIELDVKVPRKYDAEEFNRPRKKRRRRR